jgi:hypothetical protein
VERGRNGKNFESAGWRKEKMRKIGKGCQNVVK